MSVVLLVGVAGLSLQTAQLIAGNGFSVSGPECAGGEYTYDWDRDQNSLSNGCPNDIQIISYDLDGEGGSCPVEQQTCPVGTRLDPGPGPFASWPAPSLRRLPSNTCLDDVASPLATFSEPAITYG